MKLSASKFNEKIFFLRYQLGARAYVRIWMLCPCLQIITGVCYTGVLTMDFLLVYDFGKVEECKCISCHFTCIYNIGLGYELKGCAIYI